MKTVGSVMAIGKRRRTVCSGAALLIVLALTGRSAWALGLPESFADLAEKLLPAVVNISSTQTAEANGSVAESAPSLQYYDENGLPIPERRTTSLGSGFIIDPDGYIVTNNHVVEKSTDISVRLHDGTELVAVLIGRDEKTDLALLKVEAGRKLPTVPWGNSDKARVGDWVLAIGNPFGIGESVSAGIVSARNRDVLPGAYGDFIQTDAAINRGNSGGPLFNMEGEVIGINTVIYTDQESGASAGVGFAIPSLLANNIIDQIRRYGHPRRGWLGVNIQSITPELAEGLSLPDTSGALVARVTPGGPAANAGLQEGDVILQFDGRKVSDTRKLPRMVAETPIDKTVEIVVWRNGQQVSYRVVLSELPESQTAETTNITPPPSNVPAPVEVLGMTLQGLDQETREQYEIGEDVVGVLLADVLPDSPGSDKGLMPGDVIVEIDQQAVSKPEDVVGRITAARRNGYRVVTLLVSRRGDFQWVALRIDNPNP